MSIMFFHSFNEVLIAVDPQQAKQILNLFTSFEDEICEQKDEQIQRASFALINALCTKNAITPTCEDGSVSTHINTLCYPGRYFLLSRCMYVFECNKAQRAVTRTDVFSRDRSRKEFVHNLNKQSVSTVLGRSKSLFARSGKNKRIMLTSELFVRIFIS